MRKAPAIMVSFKTISIIGISKVVALFVREKTAAIVVSFKPLQYWLD